MLLLTYKSGLFLGLSLITSIGTQNLFVIKQGLKNESPYLCALFCALNDTLMIIMGVTSISSILYKIPLLKSAILAIGIIFLLSHGAATLKRSFNKNLIKDILSSIKNNTHNNLDLTKLLILSLSFSFLNPQAILDTLIIIGGGANQYNHFQKIIFTIGTISASFIWFLGLAYISNKLSSKIMKIKFWQCLEFFSASVMLSIAISFMLSLL